MDKDLRALLGQLGAPAAIACATAATGASARARRRSGARSTAPARAEAARQGTSDPAQWRLATKKIAFTPLPLVDIQYTNRPSGIHQLFQFTP